MKRTNFRTDKINLKHNKEKEDDMFFSDYKIKFGQERSCVYY
jgi:hypothetical protein